MTDVKISRNGSPLLPKHQGLRERKKARTRASIREHALRLFREQGHDATTVEQIAAAAEVSPSTFFRYFPAKEDVILRDDFDDRLFEAFDRQPRSLTPVAALRAALRETVAAFTPQEWAGFQEMNALGMCVPEVRAPHRHRADQDDRGRDRCPGAAHRPLSR